MAVGVPVLISVTRTRIPEALCSLVNDQSLCRAFEAFGSLALTMTENLYLQGVWTLWRQYYNSRSSAFLQFPSLPVHCSPDYVDFLFLKSHMALQNSKAVRVIVARQSTTPPT